MPMPSSTSTAGDRGADAPAAARDGQPAAASGASGSCTGALPVCRSDTSDCSSPSVAALVAPSPAAGVRPSTAVPRPARCRESGRCRCGRCPSPGCSAVCASVATAMIVRVRAANRRRPDAAIRPTRGTGRHASVLSGPTYSGHRAIAATGGGLRASAPVPAGRGVLGPHRRHRGVRRQSVPAARREVPRQAQYGDVPDLPQGTADVGVVGVRRPPRRGVGFGAHRRGAGLAGDPVRRVLGTRGGGMPDLQLESPGQVVRARSAHAAQRARPRGTQTARIGARTASE